MMQTRITALALLDRIFNSSSCLPSLVNATPIYLIFSNSFNDIPPICKDQWTGFLERRTTSVLEVLIFFQAMSHAAAKLFSAYYEPESEEVSKINHLQ